MVANARLMCFATVKHLMRIMTIVTIVSFLTIFILSGSCALQCILIYWNLFLYKCHETGCSVTIVTKHGEYSLVLHWHLLWHFCYERQCVTKLQFWADFDAFWSPVRTNLLSLFLLPCSISLLFTHYLYLNTSYRYCFWNFTQPRFYSTKILGMVCVRLLVVYTNIVRYSTIQLL